MARSTAAAPRLAALDVFRGFAMLWLVGGAEVLLAVVDLAGPPPFAAAITEQFGHVPWQGFHFYDLIFPMFVFAAGLSVPSAVEGKLARGDTPRRVAGDAAVRTVLLFTLGLVHNGLLDLPAFDQLRIMGVLQRIAIASFAATLAFIVVRRPRPLALLAGVLLLGYALVLSGGPSYAPGRNASDLVDLAVFAPGQLFTPTGDPEGLVSTAGAIATALLGAATGAFVRRRPHDTVTVLVLAGAGAAAVEVGTIWGTRLPIVKQLWTSSFVLVAAGWSLLLLAVVLWLVDVRPRRASCRPGVRFLSVIGRGCIVAYVGQDLVDVGATAGRLTSGLQQRVPTIASLVSATTALGLLWLVLDLLDRHGIHLHLGLRRTPPTPKAPPRATHKLRPSDSSDASDRGLELGEVDAAEVAQEVPHLAPDHDDRVAAIALAELEVAAVDAQPVDRVDVGDRTA